MSTSRERCLFLLGTAVLVGLFFCPSYYLQKTSDSSGRTQETVHTFTWGLAFSPWYEQTERDEIVARTDGSLTLKSEGAGRLNWLSWSWLLVITAIVWFWLRDERRSNARRSDERRDQAGAPETDLRKPR
jgi:hypothetical protein